MDIEEISKSLKSQREVLSERATRIRRHTRHRDEPLPTDLSDQAQELENEEVLVALDTSTTDQIRAIDHALARIEAETYGRCTSCGSEIEESRLEAYPTAERCIKCET